MRGSDRVNTKIIRDLTVFFVKILIIQIFIINFQINYFFSKPEYEMIIATF